ncbi:MAG: hypothetical protein DMG64_18545, partial [Acidobacteria bacterium]
DCRDQQNASAICSCNSPLRAATRVFPFGNIESVAMTVSSTIATCRRTYADSTGNLAVMQKS